MTAEEVRAWLRKAGPSVILVELDYMYQVGVGEDAVPTVGTKYFSTAPYIDASVPRRYEDCVDAVPTFTRSLDRATLRGKYAVTVGSLEISSPDGAHDDLLDLALDGSDVRVLTGAPSWARADFIHLFTAKSLKAAAPSLERISITLRDTAVLLNKSIGGMTEVGGSEPSANQFRPVNFGFVHNAAPILLDHTIPRYVHSDTGDKTTAFEVRNDGVSVTFTDNGDGTYDLAVPPAGNEAITHDVLAHAGGSSSDAQYRGSDLIEWLVGDRCGLTALGLYAGAGAMYELNGVNDYHLGLSITEKRNVVDVLDDVMNSLNAYWAIDRLGNFFYNWMRPSAIEFFIATSGGDVTVEDEITLDDSFTGQFKIDHNAPTFNGYQAYGNVNWFNQTTFASSLTETERDRYTRKGFKIPGYFGEDPDTTSYLGPTAYKGGAPQLYHLTLSDSQLVSTLISAPDDSSVVDPDAAIPETIVDYLSDWSAVRRSQMLPWLEFVDLVGGLDLHTLELGSVVNLTYNRYGLNAGALYQVCSIGINASDRKVALGMVRRRFAGVFGTEGQSYELREDGSFELREDGSFEIRE